jgi:acetyltransferase-like isoleucine patch superfamily enzyme
MIPLKTVLNHCLCLSLCLRGMKLPLSSAIGPHHHIKGCKHISIGKGTVIRHNATVNMYSSYAGVSLHPSLTLGNNVFVSPGFLAEVADSILIEDNVTIGCSVTLLSDSHGTDPSLLSYRDCPLKTGPVVLKQGCWLGKDVIVMPGVTIGVKTIVGAGSIVTESLPDYVMAVGSPARIIKRYNHTTEAWERG